MSYASVQKVFSRAAANPSAVARHALLWYLAMGAVYQVAFWRSFNLISPSFWLHIALWPYYVVGFVIKAVIILAIVSAVGALVFRKKLFGKA